MTTHPTLSRTLALAAGLTVIAAAIAPAFAASAIVTPALVAAGTDHSFNCRVLNAGPKDSPPVTIELVSAGGGVTDASTATIPDGFTNSVSSALAPGIRYCRVTGLSKSVARVTLCVMEAGTCIVAVSAP